MNDFVTLKDIPLLETGVAYPASTGSFTPTSSMLAEVVEAQSDPHIVAPRIKIAHVDNPMDADLQEVLELANAERDASQPSLGTIRNMRVSDDGQTLYGDLYGLPKWFADIMATAYPARSIEGGYWKGTANQKSYDFMLEAVALLGVVGPGCTSLDDLQTLFSAEGPQVQVIEMTKKGARSVPEIAAQTNVEDIRRSFYENFAQGDQYWWWDREILINPNEMIVEDPEADQLYRVPFDVAAGDGPDSVTFGDPEPIKVKYVPDKKKVAAGRLIGSLLEKAGVVLAVNHIPPRDSERDDTKETKMELSKDAIQSLRSQKGLTEVELPDDATAEQVQAAILAETPEPTPPKEAPEPVEAPEPAEDEDKDKVEAASGAQTIDSATLAQLQADAQAGREARAEQVKAERETFVRAAVAKGKFPPARAAHYLTLMSKDDVGTREFITSLAEGVVPVEEIGVAPESGEHVAATAGYDQSWLSHAERARIAAANGGTPVHAGHVVQEVQA